MAKKLFSYPEASSAALSDKLHGLVSGANRILSLQTLKNLIIGTFPDGPYPNATINIQNGKISNITAGNPVPNILNAFVTNTFPTLPVGGNAFLDVNIAGAAVNDTVLLGLPPGTDNRLSFYAYVISGGVVRIVATNSSAVSVTPASMGIRIKIIQ
jgi:hypothetical protein